MRVNYYFQIYTVKWTGLKKEGEFKSKILNPNSLFKNIAIVKVVLERKL